MAKSFFKKNHLFVIIAAGFFIRILFYLFGAKIYYGNADFMVGGDTLSWVTSIINLIDHGTYSVNLNKETGYFFRPPGYSFFIGFFYLISEKNIDTTYILIVWAQLILDTISIWLIYKIVQKIFSNKLFSAITAFLYATYPFIIVWNPVVYAETVSVFFLLLGLWFFANDKLKYNYFFSGLILGFAALTRLQIIFIFPAIGLALLIQYKKNIPQLLRISVPVTIAFILSYGLWPLRNYVNYNRAIFSQDLSALPCWDIDIMSFRDYIYSVKTDWDPQMTQIMKGERVDWPDASFIVPEDSGKLNYATRLCHECGLGFSVFMKNAHLRKNNVPIDSSCSKEISMVFHELQQNQIKYNWWNVYLWVPLSNLKKCFFKSGLYKPSNAIVNMFTTILFGFRSVLILLGLFGIVLFLKVNRKLPSLFLMILFFLMFSYLSLSFIYRNMEMRFLIQPDLLLLIPAAYVFTYFIEKLILKKNQNPILN